MITIFSSILKNNQGLFKKIRIASRNGIQTLINYIVPLWDRYVPGKRESAFGGSAKMQNLPRQLARIQDFLSYPDGHFITRRSEVPCE